MGFSPPLDAVPTSSNADSTSDEHAHSAAVSNQLAFNPRRLGWPAPSVFCAWLAVKPSRVVYVLSRMAKQKVTLSLDSEIYQRTREALAQLPGKPSISSLVDQFLDGFSRNVAPSLALFSQGSMTYEGAENKMTGDVLADFIRILSEEDEKLNTPKK